MTWTGPTAAHLARLAWRDSLMALVTAEAAREENDQENARRLATEARTAERVAEFYAGAVMLGKHAGPRE